VSIAAGVRLPPAFMPCPGRMHQLHKGAFRLGGFRTDLLAANSDVASDAPPFRRTAPAVLPRPAAHHPAGHRASARILPAAPGAPVASAIGPFPDILGIVFRGIPDGDGIFPDFPRPVSRSTCRPLERWPRNLVSEATLGPGGEKDRLSGRETERYCAEFKAKVALEAIRDEATIAKLVSRHGVHQTLINAWKRQGIEGTAASRRRRSTRLQG
jgi:hypothetical protein